MTTTQTVFLIAPDAMLDFGRDWSDWLTPNAATLASSSWTISPLGPTLSSPSLTTDETVVWVTGCKDGTEYTLTNTVVDSGGRTDSRTIALRCRDRDR